MAEKNIEVKNQRSEIKWTTNLAVAYAEGFGEGEDATFEEEIEAWSVLIQTGLCWSLQGWFGRTAHSMIENNFISKEGEINWDNLVD